MKVYQTLENGIKIIEYEERFAASLAEMWNLSRDSWGGGSDIATAQSQIDIYRNGAYFNVYLAVDGDDVVGLCSLGRYYKDADALYLHVLNVRPDYMSKKLGKAMILQCVERTIELGYPRLEIHTWPGNTKAVPLYKKCGYMWEDNSETTHLTNFIPTILAQELLKPYFEKADWYNDSTRSLDVIPDSKVSKGFDFFTYTWVSNGENLAVTFEKFGRRISKVETDDYIVELVAENHLLAYGFDYHAEVVITNKSGKALDVSVVGKNDDIISFDSDKKRVSVGKPSNKQDKYRKHPCVLADVAVNGKLIEMGVGIEATAPITATLDAERGISSIGQRFEAYITLESTLPIGTMVNFTLPENEYLHYETSAHTIIFSELGKVSVQTSAKVLKLGHVKLDVVCEIKLPSGQKTEFIMPLDVVNQGLSERFSCMTESHYGVVNGLLSIEIDKENNTANVKHVFATPIIEYNQIMPAITVSKLGKPYDDEFNIALPSDVITYESGADIIMELSFESEKQPGITMTMIYSLNAAGVITLKHRVKNSGDKRALFLNESVFSGIYHNAAYCYDGRITLSQDASDDGIGSADPTLFEENWVFENDSKFTIGICWEPALKPSLKYSDGIVLEHELRLKSDDVVETPPVTMCVGMFKDYTAFRNYARQVYSPFYEPSEDILEVCVNDYNAVVSGEEFTIKLRNNRNKEYEGLVEISSDSDTCFKAQTAEFQDDERELGVSIRPNKKAVTDGVEIVKVQTQFPEYLRNYDRAVFFPSKAEIKSIKKEGVLEICNGSLTFRADPKYFAGMFSLKDKNGKEWLQNKYPNHEPYGWWNPFIGGMYNFHQKMDKFGTLRENISADFAELPDCFGNIWKGIKTVVEVIHNKEYKGLSYENYYLTLADVPILCSFAKYINNTGGYLNTTVEENTFYQHDESGGDVAEIIHKGKPRCFRSGQGEFDTTATEFVKITATNGQKLYWLPNLSDRRFLASAENDIYGLGCSRNFNLNIQNGGEMLTRPMFNILTEKELTKENLSALERITF